MAEGTITTHYKASRGRYKPPSAAYIQKIACQFTPDQFASINNYADGMGISFAGAVRHLIFHGGKIASKPKPTIEK